MVLESRHKNVCKETIRRAIKELHYTFTRLQNISSTILTVSSSFARREYASNFILETGINRNIFFLDETGLQVCMRPYYGWSPDKKRTVKFVKQIWTRNFNVIAIINKDCLFYYKVLNNTCNAEEMAIYLNELVSYVSSLNIVNQQLIMDNVRFHHSANVKDAWEGNGREIMYLQSYCSFFNLIENLFSQWKYITSQREPKSEEDLFNIIHMFLDLVTIEDCNGYYKHTI